MEVLQSSAEYLSVLYSRLTHALEDVSHDVCAGRVEYLCALIDFGGPKQKFDEGKLIIVFVLIEGRESSIVVLVGPRPSVRSVDLVLEEMPESSSCEVLLHLSVEDEQHSGVVDVGSVFKLLAIGNASVLLDL